MPSIQLPFGLGLHRWPTVTWPTRSCVLAGIKAETLPFPRRIVVDQSTVLVYGERVGGKLVLHSCALLFCYSDDISPAHCWSTIADVEAALERRGPTSPRPNSSPNAKTVISLYLAASQRLVHSLTPLSFVIPSPFPPIGPPDRPPYRPVLLPPSSEPTSPKPPHHTSRSPSPHSSPPLSQAARSFSRFFPSPHFHLRPPPFSQFRVLRTTSISAPQPSTSSVLLPPCFLRVAHPGSLRSFSVPIPVVSTSPHPHPIRSPAPPRPSFFALPSPCCRHAHYPPPPPPPPPEHERFASEQELAVCGSLLFFLIFSYRAIRCLSRVPALSPF
ncbi:hypothetical protein C8J57DRAFT_1705289 [Mycena rebaudengoi]|nr:hypothetical protein C8J57DRAFT_1705289 [Mycena rebaudengoi]